MFHPYDVDGPALFIRRLVQADRLGGVSPTWQDPITQAHIDAVVQGSAASVPFAYQVAEQRDLSVTMVRVLRRIGPGLLTYWIGAGETVATLADQVQVATHNVIWSEIETIYPWAAGVMQRRSLPFSGELLYTMLHQRRWWLRTTQDHAWVTPGSQKTRW